MTLKQLVASAMFVGATFTAAPTFAQTFTVDSAAIAAACANSATACEAAVAQQVARLRAAGLSPAVVNRQLGVIAGTAVSSAASLPAAQRGQLANTLRSVAAASTNTRQVAAIQQLATNLTAGTAGNAANLRAVAQSLSAS